MLEIAAQKAREAGLSIVFSCQDMRKLMLPRVDALFCACDGINYLAPEELPAFFEAASACIRPGGVLLFDMSSRYKLGHVLADHLFFEDREDLTYFWRNFPVPQKGCVDMELLFFQRKADGNYERQEETQRQYWHEQTDVLTQLAHVGFSAEAYAFGTGHAPGRDCERIQFFAVKK